MSKPPVTITVSGDFTRDELHTFLTFVRSMAGREREWSIAMIDPSGTLTDAGQLLREVFFSRREGLH